MKNLLILLVSVVGLAACQEVSEQKGKTANATSNSSTIQWIDTTFQDLGRIAEGQSIEISYRFKNVSDKQLVIIEARGTCGCTVAEQPKEPIGPGQESVIKAVFNSAGRKGENTKYVNVKTNSTPDISLGFRVQVTD